MSRSPSGGASCTTGHVTRETIAGAICIYVLIGLIFANFDYGIQLVSGTPFFAQPGQHGLPDFAYFSYITMATVGYGDLTPAPGLPRTMSVLDALVGQVFLVVLLARLVIALRPARVAHRARGALHEERRRGEHRRGRRGAGR